MVGAWVTTRRPFFRPQWMLAVRRRAWRSLHERDSRGFHLIVPPGDRFYADPFLFEHQGQTFIFFEDYRHETRKGVISCVSVDSTATSSSPVTVLEGANHLSYPFIFEVDGTIYLMPDASRKGRVELHRSVRFPTEWQFERVLLEQPAADPTLWEQDGTFWLFVNLSAAVTGLPCQDLHLFFSDSLAGQWSPHPKNPIVVDASGARPAGRMFLDDGQLIRPAQDCSADYGSAIVLKRVLVLSRTDYEEETMARISSEWLPRSTGTHHFDHNTEFEVMDLRVNRRKTWREMAEGLVRRSGIVRRSSNDAAQDT